MKLIVGLGNPGAKYETTRHNAGFLVLDYLIDEFKATGPTRQHQGEIYQATVEGEKVLLLKPQTFMNLSGKAVAPHFQFFKCEAADVIVIHDDLDIQPGTFRIKTGGGSGGHNGLKSMDACLGSESTQYHRIRMGIGRPAPGSPINPVDYVLQPFKDEELRLLEPLFEKVAQATRLMIKGEVHAAMNRFNAREKGKKED